jgi:Uncharacterized conserved protein (DUF2340)
MSGFDDTLTNLSRPRTSAIITVRVIKSFEFRTERSLVLRDIDLDTTTVGDLKEIARNGQSSVRLNELYRPSSNPNSLVSIAIQTQPGWKPYRSAHFGLSIPLCHRHSLDRYADAASCPVSLTDTLKLYTQAHGAKVWPC